MRSFSSVTVWAGNHKAAGHLSGEKGRNHSGRAMRDVQGTRRKLEAQTDDHTVKGLALLDKVLGVPLAHTKKALEKIQLDGNNSRSWNT